MLAYFVLHEQSHHFPGGLRDRWVFRLVNWHAYNCHKMMKIKMQTITDANFNVSVISGNFLLLCKNDYFCQISWFLVFFSTFDNIAPNNNDISWSSFLFVYSLSWHVLVSQSIFRYLCLEEYAIGLHSKETYMRNFATSVNKISGESITVYNRDISFVFCITVECIHIITTQNAIKMSLNDKKKLRCQISSILNSELIKSEKCIFSVTNF